MQRLRTANISGRRRRHTKNKLQKLEKEKDKDKKIVDCLYFCQQICSCSIQ